MKKYTGLVMGLLLAALILLFVSKPSTTTTDTEQLIGGDMDEHGCLIAAGYSWMEDREQCIRVWELPVMIEAEESVRIQLAEKYDKELSEISVMVTKVDGEHVAGNVRFTTDPEVAGGSFLAYKENNEWHLVFDGNGSINCEEMREIYGFSELILHPQYCD